MQQRRSCCSLTASLCHHSCQPAAVCCCVGLADSTMRGADKGVSQACACVPCRCGARAAQSLCLVGCWPAPPPCPRAACPCALRCAVRPGAAPRRAPCALLLLTLCLASSTCPWRLCHAASAGPCRQGQGARRARDFPGQLNPARSGSGRRPSQAFLSCASAAALIPQESCKARAAFTASSNNDRQLRCVDQGGRSAAAPRTSGRPPAGEHDSSGSWRWPAGISGLLPPAPPQATAPRCSSLSACRGAGGERPRRHSATARSRPTTGPIPPAPAWAAAAAAAPGCARLHQQSQEGPLVPAGPALSCCLKAHSSLPTPRLRLRSHLRSRVAQPRRAPARQPQLQPACHSALHTLPLAAACQRRPPRRPYAA